VSYGLGEGEGGSSRFVVEQWRQDPPHADLIAQLRGDGIPVSYERVNARTSGSVRIRQFEIGEQFRLYLTEDGLVVRS
jgi:hypothetical protein